MSQVLRKPPVTAKEEYEKNPDLKPADIDELREWLLTQKHLPEIREEMLILFHHSCYYQMAATKECIEMFYTTRSTCPELFTKRDVNHPDLAKAMSSMHFAISPVPDKDGNTVAYYGLREYEPYKYISSEHMKVFAMMMDVQHFEAGTQPGLVIVYNMMGTRLGHIPRLNFFVFKKFFVYIQEANPVRLKKIHIVNVVSFIDKLMAIISPFLKKEFIELMHFHKAGMEDMHKEVPLQCIPKEIGGTLHSIEVLNAENTQKLAAYADYFLEDEKVRVDESKRDKKKKKKDGKKIRDEPDISFGNLEID